MAVIEICVVLLYDRTSNELDVNSARVCLFTKKSRQIENIEPTSAAFLHHVKRAVYQVGHIWGHASLYSPQLHNPCDWGWEHSSGNGVLLDLLQAYEACRELIKCSCTKDCNNVC